MDNKKIAFTKMHGAGNDYIYVNTLLHNIEDPAKAAIEWSKPHFAIGSDGLVLIGKASTPAADFSMRIFNNDGSEAMMCGNASRCIGKYVHDKHLSDKNPIRLETLSGIKILQLNVNEHDEVDSVTVDMGSPVIPGYADTKEEDGTVQFLATAGKKIKDNLYELEVDGESFRGTFVSMGNPHFVCFIDDVESFNINHYGPLLEHHPAFPQRCNIEFAEVKSPTEASKTEGLGATIRMRVWERGSGITMACGTGACATAVAAKLMQHSTEHSFIEMDGGTLSIEWGKADGHIYMTGPAAIAFEGEISLP